MDEPRRTLYYCENLDNPTSNSKDGQPSVAVPANDTKANLIGSRIEGGTNLHMPVIDIDKIPVHIEPSSTPGNCHLYIDKPISWSAYVALLDALYLAGIIEPGYHSASLARGQTFVRRPGVKKVIT